MPEFNSADELKFQFLSAKPENGVKYLVATKHTQGAVKRDFCFCDEGEPVIIPADVSYPYMVGMTTGLGTTTVMVKDGFVKENLIQQTFNILRKERFNLLKATDEERANACSYAAEALVNDLIRAAAPFQIQTVLSVGGDYKFPVRALPDFGSKGSVTVLDALCNIHSMIAGMDSVLSSGRVPESVVALLEEINDEISRVLPANPYE